MNYEEIKDAVLAYYAGNEALPEDWSDEVRQMVAVENGNWSAYNSQSEEDGDAADMLADGVVDSVACEVYQALNPGLVYATIDRRNNHVGTEVVKEYSSASDAMRAASRDWGYLTRTEQARRTISVCASTPTGDGEFDWGNYDVLREFRA